MGYDVTIDGIVLVASNFAEQVSFYRDEVGLALVDDWGDAVRFQASNGVSLTLFARGHDVRSNQRLDPAAHGLSHLEFGASRQRRAGLEARLLNAGRQSHRDNFIDADGQLLHFVTLLPEDGKPSTRSSATDHY